jgi:hypothetical protein
MRRAMGELQMIAQSDLDRERYEARLKLQRDISTALAEASDEGREQGLEQGLEQGRKEGQVEQIQFVRASCAVPRRRRRSCWPCRSTSWNAWPNS